MTGLRFVAVKAVEPAMLRDCSEDDLHEQLPGRVVLEVTRLGKFIVAKLDGEGEYCLTLHLGMTGQILLRPGGDLAPQRHSRFLFILEHVDGRQDLMEFRDIRKFGRLHLTAGGPAPRLFALGPDAWMGDWDAKYLEERLRGRRAPVKAFLLDQSNLAGIGNIYADETLWWAELSPLRECRDLDTKEIRRLATEIRARLGEGVRRLGCTLSDFVDLQGRPGTFQATLKVYGRRGEECMRCGSTITRVLIAGRGTSFCPGCQH